MKETQKEQQEHYWTTDPLSHQPLSLPIVSDSLGSLYSKDSVIEHLLAAANDASHKAKPSSEDDFSWRVKSLRDVVEVKFQVEENEEKSDLKAGRLKLVCPATNKTLGPGVKAVYLVPCGHAFLESAVREMSGENCLQVSEHTFAELIAKTSQCNEPYTNDNVITILPASAADKKRLRDRVQKFREQGLTHSLKKAPGTGKKRKKDSTSTETATLDMPKEKSKPATSLSANAVDNEIGGIQNADTASLTAKVLAEEQEKNKRRKMAKNGNLKSLFSTKNGMDEKHVDFMTRGYSIPAGAKR